MKEQELQQLFLPPTPANNKDVDLRESLGPDTLHMLSADSEKLTGVTDSRGVRVVSSTQRAEDSSESHEEEQVVSSDQEKTVHKRPLSWMDS